MAWQKIIWWFCTHFYFFFLVSFRSLLFLHLETGNSQCKLNTMVLTVSPKKKHEHIKCVRYINLFAFVVVSWRTRHFFKSPFLLVEQNETHTNFLWLFVVSCFFFIFCFGLFQSTLCFFFLRSEHCSYDLYIICIHTMDGKIKYDEIRAIDVSNPTPLMWAI